MKCIKKNKLVRKMYHSYMFWKDTRESEIRKKYINLLDEKQPSYSLDVDYEKIYLGGIEINSNCNLNCPMCNTALSFRKDQTMDLDVFRNIIKLFKEKGHGATHLHTIGEPLINPLFPKYLEILTEMDIKLILITNAQVLNNHIELLKKHINTLEYIGVSIDGHTKESYEKLRPPGKFENLIRNLELLQEIDVTKRMFSVVSKEVVGSVAEHIDFYSKYFPIENMSLNLLNSLSPDNEFYDENSLLGKYTVSTVPCSSVFRSVHFQANGNVTVCGRDYSDDLTFGSLKDAPLKDLINNDKVKEIRQMHLDGNIPKGHLCADCFCTNQKMNDAFNLFYLTLIKRYRKNWDVQEMQKRFDEFFLIAENEFPSVETVLSLVK